MEKIGEIPRLEQQVDTLESGIKIFAESLPYWAKFLAEKLLTGVNVTDNEIEAAYFYLLEDLSLKEKSNRTEIVVSYSGNNPNIYKTDLRLSKLQKVEGVNALVENQVIDFGPNVTIVYGSNGTGKSGYVRLLNKVFISRGDKTIRQNIYIDTGHKEVGAEFVFESGITSYPISFADSPRHTEFQQYSVFDGKSVLQHLDNANEYKFRPAGLSFFSSLTEQVLGVEEKLGTEIRSRTSENIYPNYFDGDSEIKTLLQNINLQTSFEEIKKNVPFSEEDKIQKDKLTKEYDELLAATRDKLESIRNLADLINKIGSLKKEIDSLNNFFDSDSLEKVQAAIMDCIEKDTLAKQKGVENFKSHYIKEIGGPEWKAFIEAAETFAKKQTNNDEAYPREDDHCLLCQQPITPEAQSLILSYWEFLQSQVEQSARKAQEVLNKIRGTYEELNFDLLPEGNVLTVWLNEHNLTVLKSYNEHLIKQSSLSANVVSDLLNKLISKRDQVQISTHDFDTLIHDLTEQKELVNKADQSEALAKIKKALTYYLHKEKLQIYVSDIETHINNLKWINMANKISWQGIKRMITDSEKALTKKYFSHAYVQSFEKECRKLKGEFGIEVRQTGGAGVSYRQLFLKGNNPSQILSEGEQKVISLSDFISEVILSDINKGMIFDDPVNSLDDDRKDIIAKRLVEEAANRQLIIFTHDLVFLYFLFKYCDDLQMDVKHHWIEKFDGEPGWIALNNSPSLESKYKKSGEAQRCRDEAKKLQGQEREQQIKYGFAALRTNYEALTLFKIFNGAVERFKERISIAKLDNLVLDKPIIDEVIDSYALCCRYMEGHLHSNRYAAAKPTTEALEEEINRFNALNAKVDALKKEQSKKP